MDGIRPHMPLALGSGHDSFEGVAGTKLKRILIIDDARDRALWLKASLELAEYVVVGATS